MCKKCGRDPFVPPECQMCDSCEAAMDYAIALGNKIDSLNEAKEKIEGIIEGLSKDEAEISDALKAVVTQMQESIDRYSEPEEYCGPDEYEPDYNPDWDHPYYTPD